MRRNLGRRAIPAHSLIPPGLLGYEPGISKEASPAETTKEHFEPTTITHSLFDGAYAAFAKNLWQMLQERGFSVRVDPTKTDQALPLTSPKFHFTLTRWFGDYPDPDTFFHGILHSENGLVGEFCGTPEINRLIEKGRQETQPQLRQEIYQEAERILRKQALLLPLFHEQEYRFARPELQNLEVSMSVQSVAYENLYLTK